jgi:hypothetical protein
MAPTLIVLLIAAVAIGVVVWFVRRKSERPYEESLDQDTAWNDTMTSGSETDKHPAPPVTDQDPRP